jgi:hypothetical protein
MMMAMFEIEQSRVAMCTQMQQTNHEATMIALALQLESSCTDTDRDIMECDQELADTAASC